MLTKNQLKQLRKEITLNSLFLKDYSNSLYIKEKTACNFFDSYMEYLFMCASDDGIDSDDVLFIIDKYDNIDNLYNYYIMLEYDSLPQDDYIAALSLSYFNGIVIYELDDNSVLIASYYNSGVNNSMHINKITRNNIFYDDVGDPYVNKDGYKYYLSEFIKVKNN